MKRDPRVSPKVGDVIHYREDGAGPTLEIRVDRVEDDMVWFSMNGQERGLSIANWRRAAPAWRLN